MHLLVRLPIFSNKEKTHCPPSTFMAHCHNGFLNHSIWCNKGQFLPLTFWVWISSSLLVLSQKDMEQGKMLGWQLKETPQPPLHSMTFTNGYSLLSHNGSNMPRALLNRTKMQAQVIRGKSIVQCRIISSRAEELRAVELLLYQVILPLH